MTKAAELSLLTPKPVDIIIPVYNAYEDLCLCMDSIYKYTNLTFNRVIIVNDCSPDERIAPYLNEQSELCAQDNKNVIVIHNEVNKGFSNNINIGISQSDINDVLFLNSDTVVTKNWIEKIQRCAYLDPSTATVTPLSNNATLCSVPKFCDENKLPEGMTIDEAAEIVERCSLHKYPRITGAHGFCMYVKREVIDKIGMLDAETFGRGYGEENDFCYRASLLGYHHVMCDDTYIYHSGTKSFVSKEKQEYIDKHLAILRERYPAQTRENDIHCAVNPNHLISENVGLHFKVNNGRKNILYVLHSDFKEGTRDNVGGTQFHVRDLVNYQRKHFNVFVIARDGEYLNLTIYFEDSTEELKYYIGPRSSTFEFHNEVLGNILDNIIKAFKISLIHVHQVSGLSFDIFYTAKKYLVPVVFTAHDYFFICPAIRMLDYEKEVCVGKDTPDRCKKCLRSLKGVATQVDFIKYWREECAKALDICEKIIVPHESDINIWDKYYPQLTDKIVVIEHGEDSIPPLKIDIDGESNNVRISVESVIREGCTYRIKGWGSSTKKADKAYLLFSNESGTEAKAEFNALERHDVCEAFHTFGFGFNELIPVNVLDGSRLTVKLIVEAEDMRIASIKGHETNELKVSNEGWLNVAFIGGISTDKGGEEIAKIIKHKKASVNWFVLGNIGTPELAELKQSNLSKSGQYKPTALPELLRTNRIDIICILSIWPETYSYTLTEALLNDIPVIVTDIGALGARVRKFKCGEVVSVDNVVDETIEAVQRYGSDRSSLLAIKDRIKEVNIKTVEEMNKEYTVLYDSLVRNPEVEEIPDYRLIAEGLANEEVDVATGTRVDTNELNQLREMLSIIQNSGSYKLARKISGLRFPGSSWLKRKFR